MHYLLKGVQFCSSIALIESTTILCTDYKILAKSLLKMTVGSFRKSCSSNVSKISSK